LVDELSVGRTLDNPSLDAAAAAVVAGDSPVFDSLPVVYVEGCSVVGELVVAASDDGVVDEEELAAEEAGLNSVLDVVDGWFIVEDVVGA
jgi:hypothetical protein